MNSKVFIVITLFLIVMISGCSDNTILVKKDFNTFNSFFANGLSCNGVNPLNLSGVSGSTNRKLNVTNFPIIVEVDTFFLNNVYDYSVSAVSGVYVINFNNKVWNDQSIGICLATSNTTISNSVYFGVNATGLDGDLNRILVTNISQPLLVSVDNQLLGFGVDYSLSSNNITFLNKLYDDMVISVWG